MVLNPKRPTLAKTALGWGTLKFRSRPHAVLGHRWAGLQYRKHLLILQVLESVTGQKENQTPVDFPEATPKSSEKQTPEIFCSAVDRRKLLPWLPPLPAVCLLSAQGHHGAGYDCNELSIRTRDVAGVIADGLAHLNGPCGRPNLVFPKRPKEIDAKVDRRERLVHRQSGSMGRPNGSIGDIAKHSAVNGAHRIAVNRRIGLQFDRRGALGDIDKFKANSLGDGRGIGHRRRILFGETAIKIFSEPFTDPKLHPGSL